MKRGNQHRRARPNSKPERRRTNPVLPIAIVCALLAGAGTAALWAVEKAVVTSATIDPARIGAKTASSADSGRVATPPIADSAAERLRDRANSAVRPAVPHNHDGHDSHDRDAHNRGADRQGAESVGVGEPSSSQPSLGSRLRASFEEMIHGARPANRETATSADNVSMDVEFEFWVEWGGGEPQSWFGTLTLDEGSIETARGYGMQADAPGSMHLEDNVVTISPRLPRSYDSLLIRTSAPRDANLLVTLQANGSSSKAFETKVPLMKMVSSTQHLALDHRGNKLIIRRTASDSLRLQTDRTSMVFKPNEIFQFSVLPNLVDFAELQSRCRVELRPARSESRLWVDEREAVRNSDGSISPAGPFKLTMPREEGVYDLIISMDKRRSSTAAPVQLGHRRKLQLVVVQAESDFRSFRGSPQEEGPVQPFQVIQEFDPADPTRPLPVRQDGRFAGRGETVRRPILHGDVVSVKRFKRDLLEIGTDSWIALPLQITQLGHPHILEIDYPNDAPQTLGIAIYEAGSRRAVVDLGLTTSVDNLAERPSVATYRVTFWPRSNAPILVLADRDSKRAATIGAIRVFAGPDRLRDLETRLPADGRLLAAHLDTPMFPELFSATSNIDPKSGRKLRDWVTFFDGAKRLIQVLKQRGYNGAVIPVLSDGGSLYPSRLLEPTPLLDDGVFFATAQDPNQKDVLEMLLRMFDREGLRLVPSVKFTATLPILETKRRLGGRSSIDLVSTAGKRWRPQPGSFGVGTHYNPLDKEVQVAMRAVVSELSQRCATHASFAGVAIQLDPDSYATLPGPDWGADDATLKRFISAQTETASNPPSEQRLRQEWLAWRAERLSEMYHGMVHNLREEVPGAQLYLLGSSLLDTPQVKNAAEVVRAPTGLTAASALLSFGINVELMREKGVVFLAPRQMKPVPSGHVDIDRAWDVEYARLFGQHAVSVTGSLLEYPFQVFDGTTLAGKLPIKDVAKEVRTRIVETGPLSRRGMAHGLAALDSQVIFDGAWQTPRDEQVWRDSMTAYRQLPAIEFETVSPPVGSKTQPVVMRRAVRGGKALFYVVNDSPRTVGTRIGFAGRHPLELKSLSATALPRLNATAEGPMLSLTLRPYEIVGIEASNPDTRVVRWETEVDQRVLATLKKNLQRLTQCVAAKRDYPHLKNPDFDQPAAEGIIPGWEFGEGAGIWVQADTHSPRHGRQALHLRSETPVNWSRGPIVWLRSEWFEPTASGRLILGGWLKTRNFEHQPHVQLFVEGRLPNNQLVRRERVLGYVPNDPFARPLGADWNYYTVFVEGLPTNVTEVRVGIELRGTGEVWVDHFGVYNLWLNEQERAGLNRDIGIATSMLEDGRVADSEQLLKSHYAQYLFANFPAPVAVNVPAPAMTTIGDVFQEPPRELPRPLRSARATAWPDLGRPGENGFRAADSPRLMQRSGGEPRQLTPATSHYRESITAQTRLPAEGSNSFTRGRDTTSATTRQAETEPATWLDRLRNFKLKLPSR